MVKEKIEGADFIDLFVALVIDLESIDVFYFALQSTNPALSTTGERPVEPGRKLEK